MLKVKNILLLIFCFVIIGAIIIKDLNRKKEIALKEIALRENASKEIATLEYLNIEFLTTNDYGSKLVVNLLVPDEKTIDDFSSKILRRVQLEYPKYNNFSIYIWLKKDNIDGLCYEILECQSNEIISEIKTNTTTISTTRFFDKVIVNNDSNYTIDVEVNNNVSEDEYIEITEFLISKYKPKSMYIEIINLNSKSSDYIETSIDYTNSKITISYFVKSKILNRYYPVEDFIGQWKWKESIINAVITLITKDRKYYIQMYFLNDSSSTTQEVLIEKKNNYYNIRNIKENDLGDYYRLNAEGELEFRDRKNRLSHICDIIIKPNTNVIR